jgi:hypothetical protein
MASPIDQLAAAYQKFRTKGSAILGMRHDVTLLIQQANQTGRTDLLPELNQRAADINQLYYDWVDADGRVQGIVDDIRKLGITLPSGFGDLGVIPLVVPAVMIAAIAAVVVTMTYVVGRYETQKQLLDAVKNKLVTPDQARDLGLGGSGGGPFGDIKQIVMLGAIVAGLAFVAPLVRELKASKT